MQAILPHTDACLTDADVIARVVAGEKPLFELLIRRHNTVLYRLGRAFGFCHADTEDLMQDAHVQAYLHLRQFEGRAAYRTWLLRIMANCCRYRRRHGPGHRELLPDLDFPENAQPMFTSDSHSDTERQVLNRELAHVLESSLQELPENYRTVFVLRELEGLSGAETAAALSLTEANVRVRLNRAKTQLQQKLLSAYATAPVYEFHLRYCDAIVARVFARLEGLL